MKGLSLFELLSEYRLLIWIAEWISAYRAGDSFAGLLP